MKKLYSFITFGIIVLFSLSLTSCNDDNIAATLDGVWEGEVTQNYSWRWNNYSVYQYVEIEFITDPYRYAQGYGYEYDYYANGYEKVRFTFEVRNEVIYIKYADGVRVRISNYRLSDNRFSGQFRDYDTGGYLGDFNFVKVGGYRYNRYYYPYSKTIEFSEENADVEGK